MSLFTLELNPKMKLLESDWVKSIANQLVSALNSALAMAPGAQKHLKNLESCRLKVHLNGLDADLFFGVSQLETDESAEQTKYSVQLVEPIDAPDVTVSGSPLAFIKFLTQKNKTALFQTKELTLEGNSVRIQQILSFLASLEIDWEGLLAGFIGDVPAHFLGSSIRSSLLWGLSFSQSLLRDTEEFIKYELRLLPDKQQAKKQFSAITKLSEELEKLKHRFDQLELKTKQ